MRWLKLRSAKPEDRHARFHDHLAALIAAEEIDAVLDVGANEGQYARSLRGRGYAGRIVSFEPGAAAHAKLSAATAGDALWTAAPRMALGRSAGSAQLRAFNRSDMNSLLPAGPEAYRGFPGLVAAEAEEVPVARLDDALDALGIDSRRTLLKIDTQGSELAVLEGAGRLLDRVLLLQLEVPVTPIYEGAPSWLDLLLPVDRLGFRPVLLSPGYFSKRLLRQIDLDVVFRRAATSDGRTA